MKSYRSFVTLSFVISAVYGIGDFEIEKWVSEPQVRSGATMTAYNDDLYLLMGFNECFYCNEPGNLNIFYESTEIWRYSTDSQLWDKITPISTINPDPRAFHSAALTDCETSACPSDSIVIFGGTNYQFEFSSVFNYGDFWYYNISANEWEEIIPNNDPYGSLAITGQSILAKGDYIYSFGGLTPFFQTTNELWRYSFVTNDWVELIPSDGVKPVGRYINRAIWTDDDKESFLIYGGNTGIGQSDAQLWEYNIDDNQWTLLHNDTSSNIHPTGEVHVGLVRKNKKVFVFGGDTSIDSEECTAISLSGGHSITDGVFEFNLNNQQWTELDNVEMPPLKRFAFEQISNDDVYIFGGFNYYCDNPGSGVADGHPIWNTDMYKWKL